MPKPAGPLPRRQRELCARTARDHLARQEFPPGSGVPPESLDPSISAVDVSLSPFNVQTKNPQKHAHADVLEKPRTPARRKLKSYLETTLVNSSRSGSG